SQETPGSVLSLQSVAVSHSCVQKPTSPTMALPAASPQTPCAPPDMSEAPAPTQLHAVRFPTTQEFVQMLAAIVVPPAADPIATQPPAQLEAPPSGSTVQCDPTGAPATAAMVQSAQ